MKALGLCVALLALAAAPCRAATVSVAVAGSDETVRYVAAAGERNDLTVREVEDSRPAAFVVSDPGATVAAGEGCVSVNAHRAVCSSASGGMHHIAARLGDGDDVLHPVEFNLLDADGGPGDDVLLGGTWDDRLDGGGGRDELRGGAGDDTLLDGDADGATDADVLDGGAGHDWVSYARRRGPVSVDLSDPGPDGAPGEGDVLTSIENAHGGRGDDRLTGTSGRNAFADEGGENRFTGGGGADRFKGAAGGRVDCGEGHDIVSGVTRRSRLTHDCETVWHSLGDSGLRVRANPRRAARGLTLSVDCDTDDGEPIACSPAVTLTGRDHRVLARGTLGRGHGRRVVRLTLTAAGRWALRRHPAVPAVLRLRGAGVRALSWQITLRRD